MSRLQFVKFFKGFMQIQNRGSQMNMPKNSSMELEKSQTTNAANQSHNTNDDDDPELQCYWRCQPIEAVQRGLQPYELDHLSPVQRSPQHYVLYQYPISEPGNEPPCPHRAPHRWDAEHVRLPCALESKYPVETEDGTSDIDSRWGMIKRALLRQINNSKELQAVILSYNTTYKGQWSFRALHKLFNEELDQSETRVFFEDLLPRISRLALRLPELIQAPIPLLKQNQSTALTLSQQQISCLLANAFLCTYPRRNTLKRKSEYSNFPDINFNRLYQSTGPAVLEKLKCIFHYFRRVCPTDRDASNVPHGCVTFLRRSVKPDQLVNWNLSGVTMSSIPMHINAGGTIEDQGCGLLQVDFANKFLGGGVLGQGCVQEEIRFVICPELFVSKLFTECLLPTETLVIVGCERYSNYTGYASSFVWAGNHEDETPYDSSRRRKTAIVAIDALSFSHTSPMHQYREDLILRELNKASIGFKHELTLPAPGIATGNWGCGAFGGDPHLKALIQMMVCAQHNRPLAYYTFGNCRLRDDLYNLWKLFRAQGTTVQHMWSILRRYKKDGGSKALYQFVLDELKKLHKVISKDMPPNSAAIVAAAATSIATTKQQNAKLYVNTSDNRIVMFDDDNDVEIDDVNAIDNDDADDNIVDADTANNDDEEQANVMMLAATLESAGGSSNSSSNISNSNNAATGAAEATSLTSTKRQFTLLEMLDRHYEQGQASNGSKRQHQPATNADKSGKTRKDCKDIDVSRSGIANRH